MSELIKGALVVRAREELPRSNNYDGDMYIVILPPSIINLPFQIEVKDSCPLQDLEENFIKVLFRKEKIAFTPLNTLIYWSFDSLSIPKWIEERIQKGDFDGR